MIKKIHSENKQKKITFSTDRREGGTKNHWKILWWNEKKGMFDKEKKKKNIDDEIPFQSRKKKKKSLELFFGLLEKGFWKWRKE